MMERYIFNREVIELFLTSIVMIAIPGPSIMFLIGQALSFGRNYALKGVVGNALGAFAVAFVVAVGMGSVISHHERLVWIIRVLGAGVLGWIGFKYLKSIKNFPVDSKERNRSSKENRRPIISGFIVGVTNPKALIIFGVVVPSFVREPSNPVGTLLAYSLVPVCLGVAIDSAWVWGAHTVGSKSHNVSMRKKTHAVGGWLMIFMSLMLLRDALTAIV